MKRFLLMRLARLFSFVAYGTVVGCCVIYLASVDGCSRQILEGIVGT